MRCPVVAAAFAAGVIAVPYQKRDVVTDIVTDVDIVYATKYVTVIAGEGSPASSAAPHTAHYGHHSPHGWASQWSSIAGSKDAAPTTTTTTTTTPAPPSSTSASSQAAPDGYVRPATPPSSAEPNSYSGIAVLHHNYHRKNHSASDIQWDDGLASTAGKIAASCVYAHNTEMDGGGYGQNIAAGVAPANISAVITDLFYNGEVGWFNDLYGQAQPSMANFESWGHMTQIVWKATNKVGCATVDCSAHGLGNVGGDVTPYFTVCNYGPPGNYANEYGDNVGSPLGEPTIDWSNGISNAGATS